MAVSLTPIRTYFADRLQELDPNYRAHPDAFNTENVGRAKFDKAFHVFWASILSSPLSHQVTLDTVRVTVRLFSKGYRDPQTALDSAMDFANTYRLRCMRPEFLNNEQWLKLVVCTSVQGEPVQSNDNAIVVRLEFDVKAVFGTSDTLDC